MGKFKRKTSVIAVIAAASVILTLAACVRNPSPPREGVLTVAVTTDALFEIVRTVGGDKVEVRNIVGDAEPHDFEPKPKDVAYIADVDLFIYNGLGLDDWAGRIQAKKKLAATDASAHPLEIGGEHDHVHAHDHDDHEHGADEEHDDHDHARDGEAAHSGHVHEGGYDPHLWLNPSEAADMAVLIFNTLAQLDAKNFQTYSDNCDAFCAEMDALTREFEPLFAASERKTFVTGHAALGYLARYFGLTQHSVSDVYASGEPSAKQLTELAHFCLDNEITVILAEAASKAVSETLARDCGAEVLTIYTMERAEDGLGFVTRMRHNLETVLIALG